MSFTIPARDGSVWMPSTLEELKVDDLVVATNERNEVIFGIVEVDRHSQRRVAGKVLAPRIWEGWTFTVDVPMLPLPTFEHTVIRVVWRDTGNVATAILTDGTWYDAVAGGALPEIARCAESYTVLAMSPGIVAHGIADSLRERVAPLVATRFYAPATATSMIELLDAIVHDDFVVAQ